MVAWPVGNTDVAARGRINSDIIHRDNNYIESKKLRQDIKE